MPLYTLHRIWIINITVYWTGELKAIKLANTSYNEQGKAQCMIWMAEGLWEIAMQKMFLQNNFYQLHQGPQSFFGNDVIVTVVADAPWMAWVGTTE